MKHKTCILPLLLLLLLLLLSYYVNAAETSQDDKKANEMVGAKREEQPELYGRRGCPFGCCGGYTRFGCGACCRPHESDEKNVYVGIGDGDDYGWGGGGRGGFDFGWGGRGGGGGGWGRWGGGGGDWGWGSGGGCRYGCCGHRYGRCYKCCYSAAEAKAYNEAHHQP